MFSKREEILMISGYRAQEKHSELQDEFGL